MTSESFIKAIMQQKTYWQYRRHHWTLSETATDCYAIE